MSAQEKIPILSPVKLTRLTNRQSIDAWDVLGPMLEKSLIYALGRVSIDDWKQRVVEGLATVLIAWDPKEQEIYTAFLCEIVEHPQKKVFSISGCGGEELDRWAHLWPAFRELAYTFECDQLEVCGRRGWKKIIDAPERATMFVEELTRVEKQ